MKKHYIEFVYIHVHTTNYNSVKHHDKKYVNMTYE